MDEAAALFNAMLHDPTDDTIRLILADRLRESDDPADQALGRFVWGGVTAAAYRTYEFIEDPQYFVALRELEDVCSAGWPAEWLKETGLGQSSPPQEWIRDSTHDRVTFRCGNETALFARGMLQEISVPFARWCSLAARVVACWPFERVRITDVPGLSFLIGRRAGIWLLQACLTTPRRRHTLIVGTLPAAFVPHATIVDEEGDWNADETFDDRAEMVAKLAAVSVQMAAELKEAAGDRWPIRPRAER